MISSQQTHNNLTLHTYTDRHVVVVYNNKMVYDKNKIIIYIISVTITTIGSVAHQTRWNEELRKNKMLNQQSR